MVIRYRKNKIDTEIEKDIITGMIVSDSFCRDLIKICRVEYFQTELSKILFKWISSYYKNYEKAPKKDIKNIFLVERKGMDEEKGELVEKFLSLLSDEYEDKETFNEDYMKDSSVLYIKERALLMKVEEIKANLELNNIEEAEKCILSFNKIIQITSNWKDLFDPDFIDKVFSKSTDYLFTFSGKLGEFLGGFKRKWMVAFLGPMKRGKTNWLIETFFEVLCSFLNCVFISLEMTEEEVALRSYKRLISARDEEGNTLIPIFDCILNQRGTCNRPERTYQGKLINERNRIPSYHPNLVYRACDVCRLSNNRDYRIAVWYTSEIRPGLNQSIVLSKTKTFSDFFGKRARIISYPMNTANLEDIKSDLNVLEYCEGFIPDVIIIDYADILKSEDSRMTGRESINETWKNLKRLAQERGCVVVTATQSNRTSIESTTVRQIHTGEDIRKIAHTDVMIGLNQNDYEKQSKFMRLGIVVHRHKDANEGSQAWVLQQLDLGQPYLDSQIVTQRLENPNPREEN